MICPECARIPEGRRKNGPNWVFPKQMIKTFHGWTPVRNALPFQSFLNMLGPHCPSELRIKVLRGWAWNDPWWGRCG